jgi:hypothetical protein
MNTKKNTFFDFASQNPCVVVSYFFTCQVDSLSHEVKK